MAADNLTTEGLFGWGLARARHLIADRHGGVSIPAIIRRGEFQDAGGIAVGFASPYLVDDRRVRVATAVPEREIARVTSPYQIPTMDYEQRTGCLRALAEISGETALKLGIWGSAGLEIYTGLPYTHGKSDLDLLVEAAPMSELRRFWEQATVIGRRYGCRVDIEVDLPSGYGVKALELLQDSEYVLGKSLSEVKLIDRTTVLTMLEGKSSTK